MAARRDWSYPEADIQPELERRRTGTSRHTSQRKEPDQVKILSGVFEGRTTGTPIGLLIENDGSALARLREDQRSGSVPGMLTTRISRSTAFVIIAVADDPRPARRSCVSRPAPSLVNICMSAWA